MAQLLLKRSSYCAAVDERSRAAAPLDATTFAAGVRRLARAAELKGHSGCVNTAMWLDGGRAVLTGSDDTHIGFATAQRSSMRLLPTPHEANIFCVRPVGNSSSGGSSMPTELASSALDGKVVHYHISSTGDVRASKVLHEHSAGANNLTVCPADPRIWLSCGGDGRVCRFDTRVGAAGGGVLISGARSAEMLRLSRRAGSYGGMTIGLHSVGYNPIAPHEFFAVGADPVTRIFDVRNLSQPVASYCPLHLRKDGRWEAGRKARGRHLPCDWVKHQRKHAETTGAQWSQDGSALVSTLTNSQIYTFQHRPTAQRSQSVLLAAGSGYDLRFTAPAPPAAAGDKPTGDAFAYRPGQVAFPLISTASIADADSAGTCPGFGDHELSGEPGLKTEVECCEHEDPEGTIQGWYTGHEHTRTIKAVSFWGPRDEYIVTGCDSGRLCVYDRYTSEKVFLAEADRAGPLNAVCRHPDPLVPMLLTCGLEDSAHVWAPVRWHSLLRFPVGRASVKDLTTGISRSPYTYAATADVEFDMAQCVGEPPEGDEDGEFGRITRTMRMVDPAVYAEEAAQLAEDLFGDGLTSTSSESSSWDDSDDEEVEDEDEDEEGSDGELGSQDIDDSHGDLHDTRWPLDTSDGEGATSSSGASGSSSGTSTSDADTASTASTGSAASSTSSHSSGDSAPPSTLDEG